MPINFRQVGNTMAGVLGAISGPGVPGGTAQDGFLGGLANTYASADFGSLEGGQGVAGRTQATGGSLKAPSSGVAGTGGINVGTKAEPRPYGNGLSVMWLLIAQIDNQAGGTAVHVDQGLLQLIGIPAGWVQILSPTSLLCTVAAGDTDQWAISGIFYFPGRDVPTLVGQGQCKLRVGEAAKMQLTLLGWDMPQWRGPNPGTNLDSYDQILG